jgi:CubicO group peptidase (beta-lactamase class C family)
MKPTEISQAIRFIENYVPDAMRETKTPGCSIAVLHGADIVYENGFGVRDLARALPATPDTLYGIGSCTKAFVATAILLLSEQGKLRLDDPVDRYIPFKLSSEKGPITIHHLLTHSSGLPALSTSEILIQKGLGVDLGFPLASGGDFYRWVNGAQKEMTPGLGERFFYSNESYRMLGHIVQTLTDMPFHEFVTKNILSPLGMTRSTFVRSSYERDTDRTQPYLAKPDGAIVPASFPYPDVTSNPEFSFMLAAGGLTSSVRDMAKFITSNLPASKTALLRPESLELMRKPYIARPASHYGKNGYGYGWTVTEDFLGTSMVSHGGSIDVSTAYTAFLPRKGVGAVILANTSGLPHAAIIEGIFAALLGRDPFEAIPPLGIKKRMDLLCGAYEAYRGATKARVFPKAGLLYLEQKDDFQNVVVPLIPEDDSMASHRFYILTEGVRQPVEFETTPEGLDLYVERNRYHKVQ